MYPGSCDEVAALAYSISELQTAAKSLHFNHQIGTISREISSEPFLMWSLNVFSKSFMLWQTKFFMLWQRKMYKFVSAVPADGLARLWCESWDICSHDDDKVRMPRVSDGPAILTHWGRDKMDDLTHWNGRVTQICVSKLKALVQIIVSHLVGAKPLSEPMLEYCPFDH